MLAVADSKSYIPTNRAIKLSLTAATGYDDSLAYVARSNRADRRKKAAQVAVIQSPPCANVSSHFRSMLPPHGLPIARIEFVDVGDRPPRSRFRRVGPSVKHILSRLRFAGLHHIFRGGYF